jgi:Lysyl oxidase
VDIEMKDLLPLLKPLKGSFGGHSSLEDYEICRNDEGKLILRFSIAIANVGSEDLHIVLGDPQKIDGKTVAPGKQIIKQDDGGQREVDIGFFEEYEHEEIAGMSHIHWHYKDLARLELVNKKDGQTVAKSDKEGYCVADLFRYPDSQVIRERRFSPESTACLTHGRRCLGITLGWCDHYKFSTEKQYIDITSIPAGEYEIRFAINKTQTPPGMIYEIDEPALIDVTITEEDKRSAATCL